MRSERWFCAAQGEDERLNVRLLERWRSEIPSGVVAGGSLYHALLLHREVSVCLHTYNIATISIFCCPRPQVPTVLLLELQVVTPASQASSAFEVLSITRGVQETQKLSILLSKPLSNSRTQFGHEDQSVDTSTATRAAGG